MSVALVSGASRGLGLALAHGLAARGWRLVVDGRDATRLAAARAALVAHPPVADTDVVAVPGDVTDPAHRAALADAAARLGGLDVLVNNASTLGSSPRPPLASYPVDALADVYRTNVLAPLALTQAVLPQLTARGGTVVNVTSDAAVEPYDGWGGYGPSKAALEHLTAILAAEHPDLHVYAVDPGDLRTDMQQAAFPDEDISDREAPEDVVPAFLHLLDTLPPSGRRRAADLTPTEVPA
jgi:NAD(P)-dependent dehydrogenase (short-subunit alcohol dehydrogenase family)